MYLALGLLEATCDILRWHSFGRKSMDGYKVSSIKIKVCFLALVPGYIFLSCYFFICCRVNLHPGLFFLADMPRSVRLFFGTSVKKNPR